MTDRPILFSAPMVRALLAGSKSQTRRALTPQPGSDGEFASIGEARRTLRICPGHRLLVRESGIELGNAFDDGRDDDSYEACGFRYAADNATIYRPGMFEGHDYERRRNSIHMPRLASRLTLTVTEVRAERLQDISEADALAEGVREWREAGPHQGRSYHWLEIDRHEHFDTARDAYQLLWNTINGPAAWDANPWVAAITFSVERRNIDAPQEAA